MDSLALWLTSLPSQAPAGRLPAPPLSRLHGERAISMVSTFQLTRSTRLTLTHPTEANFPTEFIGIERIASHRATPIAAHETGHAEGSKSCPRREWRRIRKSRGRKPKANTVENAVSS
jgi:hypothetical protein